ncbi:MAG: hypothetical protein JWN70_2621, partial [Planctomycetaceae bacterium]|nr:hypothetical protein [Planctomycetaceae bacterium]
AAASAATAKVVPVASGDPKAGLKSAKRDGEIPDKVASAIMGGPIYRHAVRSVAYSPDGVWLAAGCGDGSVRLWDVKEKKVVRTVQAHENWVFDLAFTPDGLLVTGGGDNLVRLIDPQTGTIRETFLDHSNDLHGVAVTSDGKWLVTCGDDQQVLIRSLTDKTVAELGRHDKQVTSVTISRDNQFAATSSRDGTVMLWDLGQRRLARTFKEHTADVISVAFSPDGSKLVSGGHDKTVREWNAADAKEIALLAGHTEWVFAVLFSQNGEFILTGGGDRRFRVFRESDSKLIYQADLFANVSDLALSPDGKTVAAGTSDGTVWFITLDGENSKVLPERLQTPPSKLLPPVTHMPVAEYLRVHRAIALRQKGWMESTAGLTGSGDAFTLYLLRRLDVKTLKADEAEIRQRVMQQIEQRRGDAPDNVRRPEISTMLLRASIADLGCDPLEGLFAPWLIDNLKAQLKTPAVRQELEGLLSSPSVPQKMEQQQWGAASQRIKRYIESILRADDSQSKTSP